MPGRHDQTTDWSSIPERSATAYLDSPKLVYLTGSGVGVVIAILLLLVLGTL